MIVGGEAPPADLAAGEQRPGRAVALLWAANQREAGMFAIVRGRFAHLRCQA
jgi:hypothetical protein